MASPEELELEKELESLSPEELDSFEAELTGGEVPQVEDEFALAPEALGLSPRDRVTKGMLDETAEAFATGAVEGVPFAKDVLSGVMAAGEVLTSSEVGVDELGEKYNANKADWDVAINEAEEKHPAAFMAGDIGAGFAIPAARAMKGAMIFGAMSSVSRLEDRNPYAVAIATGGGATIGAGAFKLGQGITKMISFVGQKIGMVGNRAGAEAISEADKGSIRKLNRHIKKFYNREGKKSADSALQDFSSNMMKHKVDGESFLTRGQTFERTAEKASTLREKFGKEIGITLDTVDNKTKHSGQEIYNDTREMLGIAVKKLSDNPDTVAEATAMDALLRETFFETVETGVEKISREVNTNIVDAQGSPIFKKVEELVPIIESKAKEFTLKRMFALKQDIAKSGAAVRGFEKLKGGSEQRVLGLAEEIDTARIGALGSKIESLVDEAVAIESGNLVKAKILPEGVSSFRQLNREWADMNMVEKLSNKAAEGMSDGPMGELRRSMSLSGLMSLSLVKASGMNNTAAIILAASLNKVIKDPRTASSAAVGMKKIADAIRIDPNSPYLKRMITAAAVSSDYLREEVGAIASELNLHASSVKRTSDDATMKSDDILNVLQKVNPETADVLRQAIRNQDSTTIAVTMDSLSKIPEVKKFIEPGIGWDGKVYTPEDVNELTIQVKKTDISSRQRQELLNNLRQDGTIPVIEEEPERFFKFKQRDKTNPQY